MWIWPILNIPIFRDVLVVGKTKNVTKKSQRLKRNFDYRFPSPFANKFIPINTKFFKIAVLCIAGGYLQQFVFK